MSFGTKFFGIRNCQNLELTVAVFEAVIKFRTAVFLIQGSSVRRVQDKGLDASQHYVRAE